MNDRCQAILKTGPNKGRQCGNYKKTDSTFCGVHQYKPRKNQIVPVQYVYVAQGYPVINNNNPVNQVIPVELDDNNPSQRQGARKWLCM